MLLLPAYNAGKNKRLNMHHPQSSVLPCTAVYLTLAIHGILCPGANDIIEGLGGHSEVWPGH